MTRYIASITLAAASIGTGLAQNPPAQGNAAPQVAIFSIDGSKFPRAENGKPTIWTGEELKKKYANDPNGPTNDHLEWASPYRLTIQRRRPGDAATVGGEMHEDKTQIYVITAGSGTVLLGGKPKHDASAGPGEHRSQLVGATAHHVKEGDVVSIPPMTWHAAFADANASLTFLMFHIENRQTIP